MSSFSLPGFKGQFKAYQNDGPGNAVLRWSAGDKLLDEGLDRDEHLQQRRHGRRRRSPGECVFPSSTADTTDATIAGSAADDPAAHLHDRPQRRLHFTPQSLIAGTANSRADAVAARRRRSTPNDYASPGPVRPASWASRSTPPTCTLVTPYTSCVDQELARLQKQYKACVGTNLPPPACAAARPPTSQDAGGPAGGPRHDPRLHGRGGDRSRTTTGIKRTTAVVGSAPRSRSSTRRGPGCSPTRSSRPRPSSPRRPQTSPPDPVRRRVQALPRRPARRVDGKNPDTAGVQIRQGFGLTQPRRRPDGRHRTSTTPAPT